MVREEKNTPQFIHRFVQLMKLLGLILFLFPLFAVATTGISYHGKILRPDGITPVNSTTTQFRIQIRSPGAENCLLWEEQQTKDLSQTSGVFSLTINDAAEPSLIANTLPFAIERVFSNRTNFTALTNCSAGTDYNPSPFDGRALQVFFRENPTDPWEQMPLTKINYVPLSLNSAQLEGRRASEFFQLQPSVTQSPLSQTQVNTLMDIISGGASSPYVEKSDLFGGDLSGTKGAATTSVVGLRGVNLSATAPANGQVLKLVGGIWTPAADDTGAAPGDATYAAKGVVQIDTSLATSGLNITGGVLSLPNVITAATIGNASTIPVITYDAKGRLTTVATATVNDATKLPLAGGTMTGNLNMGNQQITNAASVSATSVSTRSVVLNDNDTNTATIQAPINLPANYTLTLPVNAPTSGYVLSSNGTGDLSWVDPSTFTGSGQFSNGGNSFGVPAILGTNDNQPLSFETNSTTKMTVLANGNVGIGIAAPTSKLQVDATNASDVVLIAKGAAAQTGDLQQWQNNSGTNLARISATGAMTAVSFHAGDAVLGNIWTTYIYGTGGTDGDPVYLGRANFSSPNKVAAYVGTGTFSQTSGSNSALIVNPTYNQVASTASNTDLLINRTETSVGSGPQRLFDAQVNGTSRFTILNTGNVGIGTTSPATRLDVAGTLKIANGAEACSIAGDGGMIRYNGGNLQFCNGSAWQTLGVSGAGLTSLGGQTGSTQTFAVNATGTAPAINSATNVHTLSIPLASGVGVTSGTISKTDYDAFTAKLTSPLTTKGDLLTRDTTTHVRLPVGTNGQVLAANSATSSGLEWITPAAGDITGVTAGAGLITGGTSGDVTLDVGAGTGIVVNADNVAVDVGLAANRIPQVGGTALGAGGAIVANGTGTALSSLNCTLGQVIKFDVSGFATCGTDDGGASSTFVQNGNSFGAAATLGTNDNFALNFETNGTTKMTVLANGNVGIGTTNPTAGLEVNGTLSANSYVRANGASGHLYMVTGASGSEIVANNVPGTLKNTLKIDGNHLLLNSAADAGLVGIGTSSPNTILDVNGAFSQRSMAAPALSPAGQGRIYFDSTSNKFRVSENGGAYADLVGGGGGISGLTAGRVPYATSATAIGNSEMVWDNTNLGLTIRGNLGGSELILVEQGANTSPANLDFKKTESGSLPANNTNLGSLNFIGYNASEYTGARIQAAVDGTSGTNDLPGRLEFYTTPDGSTTPQQRMTIKNDGSVGIGTATPGAALHVFTNSFSSMNLESSTENFVGINGAYNTRQGIFFGSAGDNAMGLAKTGLGAAAQFEFIYGNNINASPRVMTIQGTGNVGIGTTTPNALLQIDKNTNADNSFSTLLVRNTSNGTTASTGMAIANDLGNIGTLFTSSSTATYSSGLNRSRLSLWSDSTNSPGIDLLAARSNAEIRFFTGGDLSANERMKIDSTGRVGIGTSSPNTVLDINGAFSQRSMAAPALSPAGQGRIYFDSTSNKFRVSENGGAYADLVGGAGAGSFVNGGNSFGAAATLGTNDNFALNFETNNSARMTILNSGNVGIGTTNPGTSFTVVGNGTNAQEIRNGKVYMYDGSTAQTLNASSTDNLDVFSASGSSDRLIRWGPLYVNSGSISGSLGYDGSGTTVKFISMNADLGFFTNGGATERMRIRESNGNVGIGTTSPSSQLSFSGNAAQTIAMERHTTANTAGNNLTVQAGGATSGGTDRNGGNLVLASGISTGNGSSRVVFQNVGINQGAGTANRSPTNVMQMYSTNLGNFYEFAANTTSAYNYFWNFATNGGRITQGSSYPGNDILGWTNGSNTWIAGDLVIGSTGTAATSSILQLSSTTRGFLLPRMTTAQRDAIATPANGLQIYNTSTNAVNFYNGTAWTALATGGAANLDALTDARTDYTTDFNMALGLNAGNALASGGQYNLLVGQGAGAAITTGDNNVALGAGAAALTTTGSDNTVVGSTALYSNTTGNSNTAVGYRSMLNATTASGNVAVGEGTLSASTFTGYDNVVVGNGAGYYATGAFSNVLIGNSAGYGMTTGSSNLAIGLSAAEGITTGQYNIAIGVASMQSPTAGSAAANIGIGYNTLQNVSGDDNIAIGIGNLDSLTTGVRNIAIGKSVGTDNWGTTHNLTTGSDNIFLGYMSGLASATQRDRAVAIGYNARVNQNDAIVLGDTTNSAVKVGIGTTAPLYQLDVVRSGLESQIASRSFSSVNSWDSGVFMGYKARGTEAAPSHPLAGDRLVAFAAGNGVATNTFSGMEIFATENHTNSAQGTSISFTVTQNGGTTRTTPLWIINNGNVGIGTSNPTYQLQLGTDSAAKPGTSTWTIASDERLKDIRAPFNRGLQEILGLETVYFSYKKDNPLQLPSNKEYVGIRAQDALKVIPEAVSKDADGYLHVTNDSIIWTAVNAIKELYLRFVRLDREVSSVKLETQSKVQQIERENLEKEKRIQQLEKENAEMKARLERIEKMIESR